MPFQSVSQNKMFFGVVSVFLSISIVVCPHPAREKYWETQATPVASKFSSFWAYRISQVSLELWLAFVAFLCGLHFFQVLETSSSHGDIFPTPTVRQDTMHAEKRKTFSGVGIIKQMKEVLTKNHWPSPPSKMQNPTNRRQNMKGFMATRGTLPTPTPSASDVPKFYWVLRDVITSRYQVSGTISFRSCMRLFGLQVFFVIWA